MSEAERQFYTIAEAAMYLGTSYAWIRRKIKLGQLQTEQGDSRIPLSELQRLLREGRPSGFRQERPGTRGGGIVSAEAAEARGLDSFFSPELIALIREEAAQAARAEVAAEVERILNTRALLTIAEFSTRSGLSQHAVRHRIDRGQLQYVRNGGRILVPATELHEGRT
jgi:hypothetical protein